MATSIGGLGSGIDSQALVAQLMQAEAGAQSKLQASKGALTVKSGAWSSLATITKGLQDKAAAVQTAEKLRASTSTTSAPGIATVTATGTAAPGGLTLRVLQLATRHQVATDGRASASEPVGAGTVVVSSGLSAVGATLTPPAEGVTGRHKVVITTDEDGFSASATVDGEPVDLEVDDQGRFTLTAGGAVLTFSGEPQAGTVLLGIATTTATSSLRDVAAELVRSGGPASAAVVDDGTASPFRLVLSAAETGVAGSVSLHTSAGVSLGSTTALTVPQNAVLKVGEGAGAMTVERPTNTVTGLMDGVTLDLVKADPATDLTITVKRDDAAVVAKVKALQESLNAVLSWVATNSKYDVAAKKGGPMVGDAGVRQLAGSVTSAVQTVLEDGPFRTAAEVGLSANRSGTYDLSESRLRAALEQDPEGVARIVAAVATAVADAAEAATGSTGVIKAGQRSVDAASRTLQERIDEWDLRLKSIESRYTRQFNALDVAMSRLNSQSSWLAGQINSLPSSS